jgi:hypothetical protein
VKKGIELVGPLLVLLCRIIGLVLGVVDICSLRVIVTLNHPAGSINHPASSIKTTCCSPTEDMSENCSNSWSIRTQSDRRICCESIWSGELETSGASGQRILLEGGKSGSGKSDATNGSRSESSTPIGSASQLVDDDGDEDGGQLGTKSIPQSRVYHDGISNEEDEDYCAENSIPSGPSDNDSEEVAWSQRNSAYSAVAWSQ